MSNKLTGTDKSVILLMTIGEDRAAEVFKHLSTREVQTLSSAMANVRQISNKQLTDVLAEFEQEAEQFAALNINATNTCVPCWLKRWVKNVPPVCWKISSKRGIPPAH
ncbi:flagellar motor switch protein G [Citrobacter koseri]|nr:flagellar motor switch protein G [Citrobacter koseri]